MRLIPETIAVLAPLPRLRLASGRPNRPSARQAIGLPLAAWIAAAVLVPMLLAVYPAPGRAASSDPSDAAAATVDNHTITEREVDQKLKDQITTLDSQIYEIKSHAIGSIAAEKLIEMAAQNAHLSEDAYLKREVDDKIPDPTEDQVRRVYDSMKSQLSHPYQQEKPGLIAYIKDEEKPQFRQDLVTRLRQQIGVKIYLQAPRVDVAVGNHPSWGPRNAKVTIIEFGDFECPFTKQAEDALKKARAKYGKKLRLVYINHPLGLHMHSFVADDAARCAADQGKFWQYHDALFADQKKLEPPDLKDRAAKLKLNMKEFNACFDANKHEDDLMKDQEETMMLRIEGTPTFYVNGELLFGSVSYDDLATLIDENLRGGGKRTAEAGD
jgi:protein-disulfide isomerase